MLPSKQNMTDISKVEFSVEYKREYIDEDGMSPYVTFKTNSEFIEGESTTMKLTKKIPKNFSCSTCINRCELQALRAELDEDWCDYGRSYYDQIWDEECAVTDIVDCEFDIQDNGKNKHIIKGLKFPDEFKFIGPNHPYYELFKNEKESPITMDDHCPWEPDSWYMLENIHDLKFGSKYYEGYGHRTHCHIRSCVDIGGTLFTPVCKDCLEYVESNSKYKMYCKMICCGCCGNSTIFHEKIEDGPVFENECIEAFKGFYGQVSTFQGSHINSSNIPKFGPLRVLKYTYVDTGETGIKRSNGYDGFTWCECNVIEFIPGYNPLHVINVFKERLCWFMTSMYVKSKNYKPIMMCYDENEECFIPSIQNFCEEFDKLHEKHLNLMQELVDWAWSPHGVRGCEHIQEMNDKYK